ncbi:MAG: acyl transferase [Bacteroidota bacterium]
MLLTNKINNIFKIKSDSEFNDLALDTFRHQYKYNLLYKNFVDLNYSDINAIKTYNEIPFIPIGFFKTHQIITGDTHVDNYFKSSGTTGQERSTHYVKDLKLYEESFINGFKHFFGDINRFTILALLPNYLSQQDSSLIYMVTKLIELSNDKNSGFYLNNYAELNQKLKDIKNKKIILIGVTYALLDLAEQFPIAIPKAIIMETGGMKGKRKELVREELHDTLTKAFDVENIYAEYGMTELLSQGYSKGKGLYETPPWMKILIRDVDDPLTMAGNNKSGGINVIDLANIYSCSFIATQDLGKKYDNNMFEVLGRFDNSDIRGCNLMVL